MGWLYRTPYYHKRSGKRYVVDRKAECDAMWNESHGMYSVLKSSMVGRVYYAAISINKKSCGKDENGSTIYVDVPSQQREVFAVITLTSVYNGDFGYKDMDETNNPGYYDCPLCILDLLTETTSDNAREWRENCRKHHTMMSSEKNHGKLPIGTVIRFTAPDGEVVELKKMAPAYQFKTPWWFDRANNAYMKKKYIPTDFEIISRPGEVCHA